VMEMAFRASTDCGIAADGHVSFSGASSPAQRDASYHTYRHVRISVITVTADMKANSASVSV